MLSSLDMDDFSGMYCTGEIYPLLHAIHHQLTAPLPPDPRNFLSQRKPAPTLAPPAPETSTFGWLESSSFYYDYLLANDSLPITMSFSTTTLPSTSLSTTTSTTKTTTTITTPTTTTITTTVPPTTSTVRSWTPVQTVRKHRPTEQGERKQPRPNRPGRRRTWPSRRIHTRNMALDEQNGVANPPNIANNNRMFKTQSVSQQPSSTDIPYQKEAQIRNILREGSNLPTHKLINSILMLLSNGSPDQPARLTSIKTNTWKRRQPSTSRTGPAPVKQTQLNDLRSPRTSIPGDIKNTRQLRDALTEEPGQTKVK